jgi:hypothetical protein
MTTLEKLQAAHAKVEEALKLLDNTDYGVIADRAQELLIELESALEGERV